MKPQDVIPVSVYYICLQVMIYIVLYMHISIWVILVEDCVRGASLEQRDASPALICLKEKPKRYQADGNTLEDLARFGNHQDCFKRSVVISFTSYLLITNWVLLVFYCFIMVI